MDRKVISWRGMAFICGALLLAFLVATIGIQSSRANLLSQRAANQGQNVSMEMTLSELKSELARVGSDGYVENEAREKHDYIKDGEMRFEFTNPQKLQNYTAEEWAIIVEEDLY